MTPYLIVYRDEAGTRHLYATAYGDAQSREAINSCVIRHGEACRPEKIRADLLTTDAE